MKPDRCRADIVDIKKEADTSLIWQREVASLIQDPQDLLRLSDSKTRTATAGAAHEQFKTRVPRAFFNKITPGDSRDPLLLQVLPVTQETEQHEGYSCDPVGDMEALQTPGLIHKYRNRVLFITTAACAIHCRYCFRRHFPYSEASLTQQHWAAALQYIRDNNEINEVILSGGDPLMLPDVKLAELFNAIAEIPHVTIVRIHSRMASAVPSRITDELVSIFSLSPQQVVVVTHINHANEIGPDVSLAMQRLRDARIQLLNQSVLLAGVNDSVEALEELSHGLFKSGILPYYLHLLDPVAGAAHFAIEPEIARGIYQALQNRLSGYLLPRLVREIQGESSKTLVL